MSKIKKDILIDLKPEEKEVLLLTGNKYHAKCLGYSNQFHGKDGQPALMYDVDITLFFICVVFLQIKFVFY